MGPGLDQVTTSFRWNTVVDARGLLLYQQYLEVLWHRRSRRGGCCAFIRFTIGFSVDVEPIHKGISFCLELSHMLR